MKIYDLTSILDIQTKLAKVRKLIYTFYSQYIPGLDYKEYKNIQYFYFSEKNRSR